jgi:hypothetical protein
VIPKSTSYKVCEVLGSEKYRVVFEGSKHQARLFRRGCCFETRIINSPSSKIGDVINLNR